MVDSTIIRIKLDIDIPNVFSPNGDGVHDVWEIKNISSVYPDCEITIFNKWGSPVWKSNRGYAEPWDGKRNGEELPVATYYFMLDYKRDGRKPRVESVTIIK